MLSDKTRAALEQRLVELLGVFLEETEIDKWPSMKTATGRGDRVWTKKNAIQTLALCEQIRGLLARMPAPAAVVTDDEDEHAKLIREAEAEAAAILKRHVRDTPH